MVNVVTDIRKRLGISRMEIARRTGISYGTLCLLERGGLKRVSDKNAIILAAFVGKTVKDVQQEYLIWRLALRQRG